MPAGRGYRRGALIIAITMSILLGIVCLAEHVGKNNAANIAAGRE